MRDTAFCTTATGRLATAYRPTPGGLVAWDQPDGVWSRPQAFGDGAAGLLSTVDDLHAFARMLLRGGAPMLTADAVSAMTSDQLTPAQKARGGLGPDFFTGRSWGFCQAVLDTGAYGWDGGFGSSWLVDPVNDLVVIVLTQRMFESPEPPKVHSDIQAAAYAALG
jgi:CubicO group peptidase (beta-lactamase class C family)